MVNIPYQMRNIQRIVWLKFLWWKNFKLGDISFDLIGNNDKRKHPILEILIKPIIEIWAIRFIHYQINQYFTTSTNNISQKSFNQWYGNQCRISEYITNKNFLKVYKKQQLLTLITMMRRCYWKILKCNVNFEDNKLIQFKIITRLLSKNKNHLLMKMLLNDCFIYLPK